MNLYKIVISDRSEFGCIGEYELIKNLEEKVNTCINEGWSCIGGFVLSSSNGLTTVVYQTMIKMP